MDRWHSEQGKLSTKIRCHLWVIHDESVPLGAREVVHKDSVPHLR